jgi:hypothetical protein
MLIYLQSYLRKNNMSFNIIEAIHRMKQIKHDRIYGLPTIITPKQPEQQHISTIIDYDEQAEHEGKYITRAYKSRTELFGKRLKHKWQHRAIGRNW